MQRSGGGLTRRAVLGWLALLGLGRRAGALSAPVGDPAPRRSPLPFLRHPESAAVLGREYLRTRAAEADADELARRLGLPGADLTALGPAEARSLKEEILRRHRDDFERGRVVDLQGWILSLTEVRLCALVSLQEKPRQSRASRSRRATLDRSPVTGDRSRSRSHRRGAPRTGSRAVNRGS